MQSQAMQKVYAEDEARVQLATELPFWYVEDGHLCRHYRASGWKASLMVVNAIGHLAEAAWHHPEVCLAYGTVTVRLSTHKAGGLTEKDFALARKIEEVVHCALGARPRVRCAARHAQSRAPIQVHRLRPAGSGSVKGNLRSRSRMFVM